MITSTKTDNSQQLDKKKPPHAPLLSDRPEAEQILLTKAAAWAINAHQEQQRASGEP